MTFSTITGNTNNDFRYESSLGNIQGYNQDLFIGVNESLNISNGLITVWDNSFNLTRLTSDTEIFINSTNVADTQEVLIRGLDVNFDNLDVAVALNGQTQVSIGNFTHIQAALITSSTTPLGDVYIAESDTLTAGVPDDDTKVKSKIIQGFNITRNGFFMVPRGKMAMTLTLRANTDSTNKTVTLRTYVTPDGGTPLNSVTYTVGLGFPEFNFGIPISTTLIFGDLAPVLPEKSFVEFKASASSNDTLIFVGNDFLIVDRALTTLMNGG